MQTVDLKELSVIELKAMAYDYIGQIEGFQTDLQSINKEILRKTQAAKTEAKVVNMNEA